MLSLQFKEDSMKRTTSYILVLFSFLLLFSFCFDEGTKPDGVDGQSQFASQGGVPGWVTKVPQSSSYYYFVGTGSGKNKADSKAQAVDDALGQVVLTINATISTQSSYSSVYEQNNKPDSNPSLVEKGYKKIKVKGRNTIDQFSVKETYYEKGLSNSQTTHVLAAVPKAAIDEAIEKMKALRAELADSPTAVIAVTINTYNKKTYQNSSLQSFFEKFYIDQGYNVITDSIDVSDIKSKSDKANIQAIKAKLDKKFKRLIYVSIIPESITKERFGGNLDFYVVEGDLNIREVILEDEKIVSTQTFSNKGIHRAGFPKAFSELEKNLIQDLTGEGSGSKDSFFDR